MGLRVNTNVASINAQRNLANVTERLGGSFRRLSTGLRISTAADDAAGLAISERLRSQVRSLDQAKRNYETNRALYEKNPELVAGNELARTKDLAEELEVRVALEAERLDVLVKSVDEQRGAQQLQVALGGLGAHQPS